MQGFMLGALLVLTVFLGGCMREYQCAALKLSGYSCERVQVERAP